jgi:hypothetical protein
MKRRPIETRLLLLLFVSFHSNVVVTTAFDQNRKEGSSNNAGDGAFGPQSHVLVRVENYRYETKKSNGHILKSNSKHSGTDVELKMVLSQELHEEPITTKTLNGNGDDDGGDDNHNRNSNKTGNDNTTPFSSTSTNTITTTIAYSNNSNNNNTFRRLSTRIWNRLDELDRMIVSSTLPLAALTFIIPLVATNDLFWVNQLGDALAVSAQSAVNMVYQMSFGLFSFLPSVTATLVSQHYANGDLEGTQSVIGQATMLAVLASSVVSSLLFFNPGRFLKAVLNGKESSDPPPKLFHDTLRVVVTDSPFHFFNITHTQMATQHWYCPSPF